MNPLLLASLVATLPGAPPDVPPVANNMIEVGVLLGANGPLASSRFALGDVGPDEFGPGFAVAVRLGLAFPQDWVTIEVELGGEVGTYDTDVFASTGVTTTFNGTEVARTNAPPVETSGRFAVTGGLKIQPPGDGWRPYGRVFGGGAFLESSPARSRCWSTTAGAPNGPLPPSTAPCRDSDIREINYSGLTAGFGLGLAWRRTFRQLHIGELALELSYAVTEWTSFSAVRVDGTLQESLTTDDGQTVELGRGLSTLHQVGLRFTLRFGYGFD